MAMSETELVEQLLDVGNKLSDPPSDPQELFSLLEQTERLLSKVEQSPSQSVFTALSPATEALVAEKLLNQSEMDLKVVVASCITEITRITAPCAPYVDYIMKDIFQMIISTFEKLNDISSPSYSKRVSILETVANVRSCLVMLDLECDALVLEMFQCFLKTIRPDHPNNVFSWMESIMTLVLEESEGISSELLSCLLSSVKEDNQEVSPIARKLGEKVINNCAVKIKPLLGEIMQSIGTSLSDYGRIVVFQCQENSNAMDSENLEKDVMCHEEFGTAADKSPRMGIGSNVPIVNGNSVGGSVSLEQKPEQSPYILQSQSVPVACRAEFADLSCSTVVRLDNLPDHSSKKTTEKKNNSLTQEATHNYSRRGNDKEVLPEHSRRAGGSKETDCLQSDCLSDKQAEHLTCSKPDKMTEIESSVSLDSESLLLSSVPHIENLLDTSLLKLEGPSEFVAEEVIIETATQPFSTSVREEITKNSQTEEEASTPIGVGAKKENVVIRDLEGKALWHSRRKELKENTYNGKSPNGEMTSSKENGLTGLVSKSQKQSSKRRSSISISKRESAGKQRNSAIKRNKRNIISEKDTAEQLSSKIYQAQRHKKEPDEKLIGSRIEIWWPDDEMFYPGVIDAYDSVTKQHKIMYDDGDVEMLMLKNERWKFGGFSETDRGQPKDIHRPNISSEKRVKIAHATSNIELASKVIRETTTTVKITEPRKGRIVTNLPQKRPFTENEIETKMSDPKTAKCIDKDLKKEKAYEGSIRFSQASTAKEQKTRRRKSTSISPAVLWDQSPGPTNAGPGQIGGSREEVFGTSPNLSRTTRNPVTARGNFGGPKEEVTNTFAIVSGTTRIPVSGQFGGSQEDNIDTLANVSSITRIPMKTTEEKHSAEVALIKRIPVNDDEDVEDLEAIEAQKRIEREKRRRKESVPSSPTPESSSRDDVCVYLTKHIFDSAFMKKIQIFSQIIRNKWYETNSEPLLEYAELADEFGRNAAFDHGNLFKTIRQSPHYRGLNASEHDTLEGLWYKFPLVFEGLHKSFKSEKYLQINTKTFRDWFSELAQAGFDISVPLAAFNLLTVSPTDIMKFRESLNSVTLQLSEENQNVEALKSKLPVSQRVSELDSTIEELKQQLREVESERMSLERLKSVELELEKYGTTLKALRLRKLKELYEQEIAEAEEFLQDVSLGGWLSPLN